MRKLDHIAEALQQLEDAGVVVLFRPMQEMNGSWMWRGMTSHPDDATPYINVYRHMHNYFTNTKGLSNLIWVYSPNHSSDADIYSTWNKPVDWAYPGDDYIDIVAGTAYDDDLDIDDYSVYESLRKPLGMGEFSPRQESDELLGTLDNRLYATRLKNNYPKIAFWVSWHSYAQSAKWSIVANENASELMNDPYIITRDDLKDLFNPEPAE